MPTTERAPTEKAHDDIVRKLDAAITSLREDLVRVELWACAVQAFARPVPGYDPDKPLALFEVRKIPPPGRKLAPKSRRSRRR